MQKRNMDEMISYFNRKVADMDIELKYKMELLCMVTAFRIEYELQKQKTGKWIDLNATDRYKRVKVYDHFECPICHERSSNDSKYCPNCGAKMDGKGIRR